MAYIRLNISNLCNFSCKYCHVFNITKNKLPPKVMDYETIEFAIENFIKILKKYDENFLLISIYGGETLINKKNLFKAIEKYDNKYSDVTISWRVNTNGSLLTEEVADFFKVHNIDVHLSVDGFEETHNKNRVDKFGKGTFDRVEKALDLIKQKGLKAQINSFVFPENIDKLPELIDLAKSFNINRIYLDLFYDTQNRDISPFIIAKKYFKAYKYGRENGISISGPWMKIFKRHFKKGSSSNKAPVINVTVDGKFLFNIRPTMTPLDLKHLNYDDLKDAYTMASSQLDKITEGNCRFCFLRKCCKGSMINQFQYHTKLNEGWEKACISTREIVKLIKKQTWT